MPRDPCGGGGGGRNSSSRRGQPPRTQSREVIISKALSRLLRHSAVQDHVPMDSHGYVRMDHLMNWQRLKSMQPRPTMEDVIGVVVGSEKKRFGLRFGNVAEADVQGGKEAVSDEEVVQNETQTETQKAIDMFQSGKDVQLDHYFIRANQGHSIKGVEAEDLLDAITLGDDALTGAGDGEKNVPGTVVHGTFYGAWEMILKDGGLRSMSRNHVHFSTGPPLEEVLKKQELDDQSQRKGLLSKLMEQNKVVSGMRPDANILIYVNVRDALKDGQMKWWKSENGVILTDGLAGLVPMKYWDAAVEVNDGLGLIWDRTQGVVKELPPHLKGKALPFGKRRGGAKMGGRGAASRNEKPRMKVERDDLGDE